VNLNACVDVGVPDYYAVFVEVQVPHRLRRTHQFLLVLIVLPGD
jgi:hypothetical protein